MTRRLRVRFASKVRSAALATALALPVAFAAQSAHADPCDDIAKQLASQ
jgi:hypothetical protein